MAVYSLINRDTGEVVNVIEVDPAAIDFCGKSDSGVTPYAPPDGFFVVKGALPIKSFYGVIKRKHDGDEDKMESALKQSEKAKQIIDKRKEDDKKKPKKP